MDDNTFVIAAFIGALAVGFLIGLVPLITGIVKKRIGLAIGGFFACLAGGAVLGILLALPLCILFMWLILRKRPEDAYMAQQQMGMPPGQPYPPQAQTGAARFCPHCGQAVGAQDQACGHCGTKIG